MALKQANIFSNFSFKDEDFFSYISEDRFGPSAVTIGLVCFVGDIVSLPLLLGALSYKLSGSLNYQTLIDKIYSHILVDVLFYIATSMNVYCLRVFGALPTQLCVLLTTHGAVMSFIVIVCIIEIMILRYFYTCVWKQIGFLNDEVFGRFFAIFNLVLGLMYAVLFVLSQGHFNLTMAMCDGKDPTVYSSKYYSTMEAQRFDTTFLEKSLDDGFYLIRRIPLLPVINAVSGLTCLVLSLIIHFKIKKPHQAHAISQNQIKTAFGFGKSSTMLAFTLAFLCSLPFMIVRRIIDDGNINEIPKFILTLTNMLPLVPFLVVLPALLYLTDPGLRTHVTREIKDSCIYRIIPHNWK